LRGIASDRSVEFSFHAHAALRREHPLSCASQRRLRNSWGVRKTFKADRYRALRMRNNERFIARWAAVSIIAQSSSAALAFIAVAASWAGVLPVILLEACLLGAGQRWVMRRTAPGLERGWFAATVGGMVVGRYVQFGADTSVAASTVAAWPGLIQILLGAVLGSVVGALMAAPQAYLLAQRVPGAWRWIAVRSAAWSIALPALMVAGSWLAAVSGAGFAALVATMFASFAIVGAFVGLAEGIGLAYLIRAAAGWQKRETGTPGGVGCFAGSLAGTILGGQSK
jgi:hypothetical protein